MPGNNEYFEAGDEQEPDFGLGSDREPAAAGNQLGAREGVDRDQPGFSQLKAEVLAEIAKIAKREAVKAKPMAITINQEGTAGAARLLTEKSEKAGDPQQLEALLGEAFRERN